MLKRLSTSVLLASLACAVVGIPSSALHAQTTLTIEKRVSTDSSTGRTTVTFDTIIGRTENITRIDNMLEINPLAYLYKFNLTYFRTMGPSVVAGVGVNYGWLLSSFTGGNSYGVNAEVRFYTQHKAPHGFYLAPNISVTWASGTYYYTTDQFGGQLPAKTTVAQMTAGVLAGWQWFPSDNFGIGLAFGFDYFTMLTSHPSEDFFFSIWGDNFTGIVPALRFDICYAW